jgi:hypothetical protein
MCNRRAEKERRGEMEELPTTMRESTPPFPLEWNESFTCSKGFKVFRAAAKRAG